MLGKKQKIIASYYHSRRMNTDIYSDTYRGGMDDYLYTTFSLGEIQSVWKEFLSTEKGKSSKIDFYVHIPFCFTICKYCDYYKLLVPGKDSVKEYLDYIYWYLDQFKDVFSGVEFNGLYIGGGTPSMLLPHQIDELLGYIFHNFSFRETSEKTFEINPANFTLGKAEVIKKYPINRISMGIQSLSPEVLEESNRFYQKPEHVEAAVKMAYDIGIKNINGDLIMGLKEDSLESMETTISYLKKSGFSSLILYWLLPTDEYLAEHYDKKLDNFYAEFLPKIDQYHTLLQSFKENELFEDIQFHKNNGYRWDIYFRKEHLDKYDDFSQNSLFGAGSSARSHIYEKLYYKILDNSRLEKNLSQIAYTGRYIDNEDEKSLYVIIQAMYHNGIRLFDYYEKFGEDFFATYGDVIYLLERIGFCFKGDNEITFSIPAQQKNYFALFFLPSNKIREKEIFSNHHLKKLHFFFLYNLEISIFFDEERRDFLIYNNYSLNTKNTSLYHSIYPILVKYISQINENNPHLPQDEIYKKILSFVNTYLKNILIKVINYDGTTYKKMEPILGKK